MPTSLKVTGNRDAINSLREELLADPRASELVITEIAPVSEEASPSNVRVRDPSLVEHAVVGFLVHVAAGMAIHGPPHWVRKFFEERADDAQARVKEVPASKE